MDRVQLFIKLLLVDLAPIFFAFHCFGVRNGRFLFALTFFGQPHLDPLLQLVDGVIVVSTNALQGR